MGADSEIGTAIPVTDGEGNQRGDRLQMPNGEPALAMPQVHDRRATAVVGSRHAHEVLLRESLPDGLHPVASVRMRTAAV